MSNRDPNKVKIGHWQSMCCELDLFPIVNEDDLSLAIHYLQEAIDNPTEDVGMHTWETKEEALAELAKWNS